MTNEKTTPPAGAEEQPAGTPDASSTSPPETPPASEPTTEATSTEPIVVGPITVEPQVVLPPVQPVEGPFSESETQRNRQILTANGFGDTIAEWRRAAEHTNGLIRVAAYHLLTRQPDSQDEGLFRRGLQDRDESVRALAAYGLIRLGDDSVKGVIEEIARLDVEAFLGAPRAAGILGELGEPAGFATILRGMKSNLSVIRVWTMKNALPFAALHGQEYASGKTIDIWALYTQALQDSDRNVRQVARAQLLELNTPQALKILENDGKDSR